MLTKQKINVIKKESKPTTEELKVSANILNKTLKEVRRALTKSQKEETINRLESSIEYLLSIIERM